MSPIQPLPAALERTVHNANYVVLAPSTVGTLVRRSVPTVASARLNTASTVTVPANVMHVVDDADCVVVGDDGAFLRSDDSRVVALMRGTEVDDLGGVFPPARPESSSCGLGLSVSEGGSDGSNPESAAWSPAAPFTDSDIVGANEQTSDPLGVFTGASVLVVCGDGCLLGRSRHDGFWHDFGGRRDDDSDENPIQTAERELREETGLELASLVLANHRPVVVEHKGNVHAVFVAVMPDAVRSSAGFDADANGVIGGNNVGDGELTAFAVCRDFDSFFASDLPAEQAVHRRFRDVRVMALAEHAFDNVRCSIDVDPTDVTVAAMVGGKRRDRVEADRVHTGPIPRGSEQTSGDASRFRGFSIDNVMAFPLDQKALVLAEVLVDAMSFELDDDAIVDGGPMQLAFGLHLRHVIDTTDKLVLHLRSYRAASVAVRQRYILRHGLQADPDRLKDLDGLVNRHLLAYVTEMARVGVHMRSDEQSTRQSVGPHQSASHHVLEAYVKCFEDFSRCGALMVSERCESFMSDVSSSPFGRVPKKDVFGFVTREGRFVHDCSYPRGASTNDRTPAANHAPAICPTHIEAFLYIIILVRNASWHPHSRLKTRCQSGVQTGLGGVL